MSYFKKARKYNKPSITLDEKIAKANREYEKTNVLLEGPTNSTSGLYFASQQVEGTPAVMTPVPDNTGFGGGGTQNANGGDQNDSGTWDNGWQSTDDMRNSDTLHGVANRPIPLTPDLSGWNGTSTSANSINFGPNGNAGGEASGVAIYSGDQGQSCIGSIGGGNIFTQILVGDAVFGGYAYPADQSGPSQGGYYGSYSDSEFGAAQNLAVAYEANKNNGGVTRLCWVPFDTVNSSQSYANYSGAKKTTNFTTPSYPDGYSQQWALHPVTILNGQNTYESQAAVPAHTTIVYKDDLGNGEYLNMSGFQNLLKNLFGLAQSAIDALYNKPYEFGEYIGANLEALAAQIGWGSGIADSISNNTPHIAAEPSDGEKQDYLNDINPSDVFDPSDPHNIQDRGTPINDQRQNFADGNIYVDDNGEVQSNIGPNGEKGYYVTPNATTSTGSPTAVGSRGEAQTQVYQNENGDWIFAYDDHAYHNLNSDDAGEVQGPADAISNFIHNSADAEHGRTGGTITYNGGELGTPTTSPDNTSPNTGDMANYPCNSTACIRGDNISSWEIPVNEIQNDDLRNKILAEIESYLSNQNEKYEPRGQLLTEKNHLRDLREKKREKTKKVADRITKINIPGPKDHLTVRAIDMLRQYKVSPKEMQEYVKTIGEINQWIRDNSKEYEIWKVRYPANDPRTAELNWRMDQQLKASAEYVESRFPENKKLFAKLKDKIQANIDVTSPENFKGITPVITHKRLLSVSRAIET